MDIKDQDVDLSVTQQKYLNGLAYETLPETAVATARTHKKNFFQKSAYDEVNNTMICDLNTGASFINAKRSFLAIKLYNTTPAATSGFGIGGITNIIKRVVITSRTGKELSRVEDYNLLAVRLIRMGCGADFVDKFGSVMGYYNNSDQLGTAPEEDIGRIPVSAATARTYLLPLTFLSGFFQGDGKSLIPPHLAAGLRIELTLESSARALVASAGAYAITDCYISTSCLDLVDSWQRQINEESARDGLTYSYPEWHTTSASMNSTRVNIEVRKAVARAISAFVVRQIAANALAEDNMKGAAYDWTSVQWRMGSLYPTQQPIETPDEAYFLSQSMWDSDVVDCKRSNGVDRQQFVARTTPGATGALNGLGCLPVSLERNDVAINNVLNISGMPTNNSRTLSVDATSALGSASTCYLFMKHLRLCKAYLDNVVVSE